jgi:hypothetical protein
MILRSIKSVLFIDNQSINQYAQHQTCSIRTPRSAGLFPEPGREADCSAACCTILSVFGVIILFGRPLCPALSGLSQANSLSVRCPIRKTCRSSSWLGGRPEGSRIGGTSVLLCWIRLCWFPGLLRYAGRLNHEAVRTSVTDADRSDGGPQSLSTGCTIIKRGLHLDWRKDGWRRQSWVERDGMTLCIISISIIWTSSCALSRLRITLVAAIIA